MTLVGIHLSDNVVSRDLIKNGGDCRSDDFIPALARASREGFSSLMRLNRYSQKGILSPSVLNSSIKCQVLVKVCSEGHTVQRIKIKAPEWILQLGISRDRVFKRYEEWAENGMKMQGDPMKGFMEVPDNDLKFKSE